MAAYGSSSVVSSIQQNKVSLNTNDNAIRFSTSPYLGTIHVLDHVSGSIRAHDHRSSSVSTQESLRQVHISNCARTIRTRVDILRPADHHKPVSPAESSQNYNDF